MILSNALGIERASVQGLVRSTEALAKPCKVPPKPFEQSEKREEERPLKIRIDNILKI
ncbi:MAG: hypothetical protein NZ551_06550 [Microscillaceae bacterium]|nr:hypothetical protein [Microscillaceae bacterium]MDW8460853.1 hypothetical protein [Cytophagales bacterium]